MRVQAYVYKISSEEDLSVIEEVFTAAGIQLKAKPIETSIFGGKIKGKPDRIIIFGDMASRMLEGLDKLDIPFDIVSRPSLLIKDETLKAQAVEALKSLILREGQKEIDISKVPQISPDWQKLLGVRSAYMTDNRLLVGLKDGQQIYVSEVPPEGKASYLTPQELLYIRAIIDIFKPENVRLILNKETLSKPGPETSSQDSSI
jgi:hypothetical protein